MKELKRVTETGEFKDDVIVTIDVDDDTAQFEADFDPVLDCKLNSRDLKQAFIRKNVIYTCSDNPNLFKKTTVTQLVSIIEGYECGTDVPLETKQQGPKTCNALKPDCSNGTLLDNVEKKLAKELCSSSDVDLNNCTEAIKKVIQDRKKKKVLVNEIENLVDDLNYNLEELSEERQDALERLAEKQKQGKLEAHCPNGTCFQKPKQSNGIFLKKFWAQA